MKLLRNYKADIPASIVVVFVATPLCLGIALASGAPLFSGLIAGIIGGIVVGSISDSQHGVSGPAAGLAVIVFAAIDLLGFEAFLVAVVLAGLIQIVLGLIQAGYVAYFFPSAVIKGMLAGIGVIIILKQIPHAAGYDSNAVGEIAYVQPDGETTFSAFLSMLEYFDTRAIIISVVSLAILVLWEAVLTRRALFFRLFQGPLAAVAFGGLYQLLTSTFAPGWALESTHLVSVPVIDSLSEITTVITNPDWSRIADPAVYMTAATLAIVASLESLLCVEATDKMDKHRRVTPPNRELVAQGVGNVCSGLVGGLPITQVIIRSSANVQSGNATKLSAILHGVFLLILVFLLPAALNLVPLAVLAAILLMVGYKLATPALFKEMYRLGARQFLPFVITVLGIVFADLLLGIAMGLTASVLAILRANYLNSHILHLEESDRPGQRHSVSIKLSEEVTFLNRATIKKALEMIPEDSDVKIDTTECFSVDYDVEEVINDFEVNAADRNIVVQVVRPANPGARVVSSNAVH